VHEADELANDSTAGELFTGRGIVGQLVGLVHWYLQLG